MEATATRLGPSLLAVLGSLALAASAPASPGKKLASADGSGQNPVVRVGATAKKPAQMRVEVENDPAGVKVSYKLRCVKKSKKGKSAKTKSGGFTTANTYTIRKLGLPIKKASTCKLNTTVRFVNPPPSGSMVVKLYFTKQKK
jgi:hypothetical protein